jgi:hypothetical protein
MNKYISHTGRLCDDYRFGGLLYAKLKEALNQLKMHGTVWHKCFCTNMMIHFMEIGDEPAISFTNKGQWCTSWL